MPILLRLITPPYPRWYDLNACYKYHTGAISHFTENCIPLKEKIVMLIKHGWLKLGKIDQLTNVNANPLLNYKGSGNIGMNMV